MNCKKGELAIIIKSKAGNEGLIVECVEFIPALTIWGPNEEPKTFPGWRINRMLKAYPKGERNTIWDHWLRPIPPLSEDTNLTTQKELEHV